MRKIMIVAALLALYGCGPESQEDREQRTARVCTDSSWAWVKAQRYVKSHLKDPSSAEFPSFPVAAEHISGCAHVVVGEFTAKNSFGATVSQRFSARMTYDPREDTWTGSELNIQ